MTLLGRHDGRSTRRTLRTRPAAGRGSCPSWQISLVDDEVGGAGGPRGRQRATASKITCGSNGTLPRRTVDGAAQLSNCVLRLASGTQTHDLRLRQTAARRTTAD